METLEMSQRARRRLEVFSLVQTGKLALATAGELWGVGCRQAESLAEEGLKIVVPTLRRWLLAEGLWTRQRRVKTHRRRERKEHLGEMVLRPRTCIVR